MNEQKRRFLQLYTKNQDNNILSDTVTLDKSELKFLSTTKENKFFSEAKNLERIVLEYFFSIYFSISNKPEFDKYYRSIFFYYHNKFIKKITKKKYRKSYTSAKASFPKERKLLKREIESIEGVFLPIFTNYKNTIDNIFFEIKEFFSWYEKDVRIYISNIRGEFFLLAYPSHHFKLSIYPLLLSTYSIGCNFEELFRERAMQLGDKFVLRDFIDEFLAAGMIPISLTRWEMTGYEDEIKKLW